MEDNGDIVDDYGSRSESDDEINPVLEENSDLEDRVEMDQSSDDNGETRNDNSEDYYSMEAVIQHSKQDRKAEEVTELVLNLCKRLTTLEGFPPLPNLQKLELSCNQISGGLHHLLTSPKLININLSGNKLSNLADLEPLAEFKDLRTLEIFNNEIKEDYRKYVFQLIPTLEFLDGFDEHNRGIKDSDDEELQICETNEVDSDEDNEEEDN